MSTSGAKIPPRPVEAASQLHFVADLLNRPATERLREYKYRFAQSAVFGLPVVAVSLFGFSLGGPEAGRWVGLLQMLMGGWVIYVGALAMIVDALLRKKWTVDGLVGMAAVLLYAMGVGAVLHLFLQPQPLALQQSFLWGVVLVCLWNGLQWLRFRKHGRSI